MQSIEPPRSQIPTLHFTLHQPRRLENAASMDQRKHSTLSPATIGFLVPLFVIFLIGPFLCVYLVRRRRLQNPTRNNPRHRIKKPPESREEARKKLDGVTEVSTTTTTTFITKSRISVDEKEEKNEKETCTETISVLERDCAICLSTLHHPSQPLPQPEPAITRSSTTTPPSISALSLSSSSPKEEREEILRLNVCGHEFHAECLISWCCMRKYSCPICRAVYFIIDEEEKKEGDDNINEESVGVRERDMEEGRANVMVEERRVVAAGGERGTS